MRCARRLSRRHRRRERVPITILRLMTLYIFGCRIGLLNDDYLSTSSVSFFSISTPLSISTPISPFRFPDSH